MHSRHYGPLPVRISDTHVPNGYARLRNKITGFVIVQRIWRGEDFPYDRAKWEEIQPEKA
jgi:hypothetical protein